MQYCAVCDQRMRKVNALEWLCPDHPEQPKAKKAKKKPAAKKKAAKKKK